MAATPVVHAAWNSPVVHAAWNSRTNPSALKLWITSRTRSGLVNVTFAIFGTAMPWADATRP